MEQTTVVASGVASSSIFKLSLEGRLLCFDEPGSIESYIVTQLVGVLTGALSSFMAFFESFLSLYRCWLSECFLSVGDKSSIEKKKRENRIRIGLPHGVVLLYITDVLSAMRSV